MNISDLIGKNVLSCSVTDVSVAIFLEGGVLLRLVDYGQSCCGDRYLNTDDDPSSIVGKPFNGYELKDCKTDDEGHAVHEIQFLEVRAGFDSIVVQAHNEHNGYYGGFNIVPKIERLSTEAREARLKEWHKHLAWLPVRVGETECRWLEYVYRKDFAKERYWGRSYRYKSIN